MIRDYIRKELQNFKPYHAAFRSPKIKLDANESPFALSENVKNKLIQWISNEENIKLSIQIPILQNCVKP